MLGSESNPAGSKRQPTVFLGEWMQLETVARLDSTSLEATSTESAQVETTAGDRWNEVVTAGNC